MTRSTSQTQSPLAPYLLAFFACALSFAAASQVKTEDRSASSVSDDELGSLLAKSFGRVARSH
jgi:hypothetical protein